MNSFRRQGETSQNEVENETVERYLQWTDYDLSNLASEFLILFSEPVNFAIALLDFASELANLLHKT